MGVALPAREWTPFWDRRRPARFCPSLPGKPPPFPPPRAGKGKGAPTAGSRFVLLRYRVLRWLADRDLVQPDGVVEDQLVERRLAERRFGRGMAHRFGMRPRAVEAG